MQYNQFLNEIVTLNLLKKKHCRKLSSQMKFFSVPNVPPTQPEAHPTVVGGGPDHCVQLFRTRLGLLFVHKLGLQS